jgi:hypothetical protein
MAAEPCIEEVAAATLVNEAVARGGNRGGGGRWGREASRQGEDHHEESLSRAVALVEKQLRRPASTGRRAARRKVRARR